MAKFAALFRDSSGYAGIASLSLSALSSSLLVGCVSAASFLWIVRLLLNAYHDRLLLLVRFGFQYLRHIEVLQLMAITDSGRL